ncbi:MAG TPA: hypothetical protein VFK52_11035 [Nocardioidaceae bacterium]|nr:hypothetical protein [Nocardioidaceae bacterium]
MNVEEKVREALQRAGQERHVDVPALHDSTRRALLRRSTRPRLASWRPILLGAAAAVLAIGAVVTVPRLDLSDRDPGPSGFPDQGVDDEFSCPLQGNTRFGPDTGDGSFRPQLSDDLRPTGEAARAPRWETEVTGSSAVLRLGNADGTLASLTRFVRSNGGWQPDLITRCIDSTSPQADLVPGGRHEVVNGSLQVVDRLAYDVRGLETRQTVWAKPCDRFVCLTDAVPVGSISGQLTPGEPQDATFYLGHWVGMPGEDLGVRLVVVYDRAGTLGSVDWVSTSGQSHIAEPLRGGWRGPIFAFLAADSDLAEVHLHDKAGENRIYERDEFLE